MSKNNSDVFHRMNYLYQISQVIIAKNPKNYEISRHYSKLMCRISKKTLHKMNYEIKRKICKKCNSLLLPGITASVRYKGKNKRIIVTCKNCKQVKRFCTSKDYTLWYDQQEIENRQVDTEQEDNSPSNNKIAAITLSKENNLINSNSIVSAS